MAAVLLSGALFSTSCSKWGLFGRGGQITFGTATGEVATKTAYGDDYKGSNNSTWQFINWEENDVLTIVSAQASVDNNGSGEHVANYVVTGVENDDPATGHQSKAKVSPTPNGLCWKEGYTGEYDFFAVFPAPGTGAVVSIAHPDAGAEDDGTTGTVTAQLPAAPELPESPTKKYLKADGTATTESDTDNIAYTYDVYAPDMDYAVMTAAAIGVEENDEKPQVSLLFKPAFTAFEINLTSGDENFSVTKIELIGAADKLAGEFTMTAGDLSSVDVDDDASNSVAVTPGTALALTPNSGFTITLFTLPVNTTGMVSLKVTTTAGIATLPMTGTDGTSAYQFEAGKKYRINMLKLGGTWKYKILLDPEALPWDLIEEETTFSQNIQSSPFNIKNDTEHLDPGFENHYYPSGTKDYQVRTLDMGKDYGTNRVTGEPNKPYFLVTFTPMAPLGGYWQLIPQNPPTGQVGLGTNAFKVEVWDTDSDEGSTDLKGQIMTKTITLHVTSNVTDDQRTEDSAIIIKAIFSTSPAFDENSTYSADSEIQDAHKDGSFSYWRFVIPAKAQ